MTLIFGILLLMRMPNTAAIIPVFNPEAGFRDLCLALSDAIPLIVVVDDGSLFNLDAFTGLPITVLRHPRNFGKGHAMKTAIAWLRTHAPDLQSVVFADGDGQHCPADIVRVLAHSLHTNRIVLGVRNFSSEGVPMRSRFGNAIASFFVNLLFSLDLRDTQTGLRAIPSRLLDMMLAIPGDRYEYEMRLFRVAFENGEILEQLPIRTVYVADNHSSHFRPLRDSVRVYVGLFGNRFPKFCISSLVGFLVDNVIFSVVLLVALGLGQMRHYAVLYAIFAARLVSTSVNYLINRCCVFHARSPRAGSAVRYMVLAIVVMLVSYGGTLALSMVFDANGLAITLSKIFVETLLFIVTYHLQKQWVFAGGCR